MQAFTFVTGDPRYDELPWVRRCWPRPSSSVVCRLHASDSSWLARSVQPHEDEPFGGMPTLGYARLFEEAREAGVIVLLDGQGMDEQWAGYDYYRSRRLPGSPGDRSGHAPTRLCGRNACMPEFRGSLANHA